MAWQGKHWLRDSTRERIHARDGWTCVYCGTDLRDVRAGLRQVDHVSPRVRGGANKPSNLVTACITCNSSKSDTPARVWLADQPLVLARVRRVTRRVLPARKGEQA